jgi:hypothetical protein
VDRGKQIILNKTCDVVCKPLCLFFFSFSQGHIYIVTGLIKRSFELYNLFVFSDYIWIWLLYDGTTLLPCYKAHYWVTAILIFSFVHLWFLYLLVNSQVSTPVFFFSLVFRPSMLGYRVFILGLCGFSTLPLYTIATKVSLHA